MWQSENSPSCLWFSVNNQAVEAEQEAHHLYVHLCTAAAAAAASKQAGPQATEFLEWCWSSNGRTAHIFYVVNRVCFVLEYTSGLAHPLFYFDNSSQLPVACQVDWHRKLPCQSSGRIALRIVVFA